MNRSLFNPASNFRFLALVAAIIGLLVAGNGNAQRKSAGQSDAENPPAFHEYRGVQLGMTSAEVRKKLGDPKDKSDEQDFFIFSDTETAQIVYDKTQKVITISADFMSLNKAAPTAKDVVGIDLEAKPDGSLNKVMRFPKAGYWLSYNRTPGADFVVTITLQKL